MSIKIDSEIYEKKEEIGKGGFGIVYKLQKDNEYYALKKILIINSTEKEINYIKEEVDILSSFDNVNISLNIIVLFLKKIILIY